MRQLMRRTLPLVLALALPSSAWAKPWQGIEPGVHTRQDVERKFGTPTKVIPKAEKELIAYMGKEVIKGTTQAQFTVDAKTKVVERIDVFPGPVIDKDTIEQSYGGACPPGQSKDAVGGACYAKKVTDDFRMYFLYSKLGLAIFFNQDGKTVHSFVFQAAKK